MRVLSNLLLLIGAIALGLMASVNLYDIMLTDDPARFLFTHAWWSPYWPIYAVIGGVLAVGILLTLREERG